MIVVFPKGKNFFVTRLNVTSKKSVLIRFIQIVIESLSSLNNAIMVSIILSSFGPFALFIAASLLSLYKPTPILSVTVFNRFNS